ncbi:MAG: hypothetical protein ACLUHD_15545 [Eggerthella lenta]
MAIFHLNYRGCSPATGAGAVRKAAYQSGQALVEERTGQLCDYARKERVVEEGLSPLSISIRQAKAFLQLVERHGLKPAGSIILDLLH